MSKISAKLIKYEVCFGKNETSMSWEKKPTLNVVLMKIKKTLNINIIH